VVSLVATPNRIYLGGLFSRVGTGLVHRITAVDPVAGANTCWNPEVTDRPGLGSVKAIALSSNAIYAGGSFTNIGGQPRRYLAALDPNCPGNATSWQPLLDASVDTLAVARGSVVAGGAFQRVAGLYRPNLAVFPLEGSPALTVQPTDQKTNVGQTVSLNASATGNGTLSYQWQRNGTNVLGATAATLTIPNAQVSHSGIYTLVATNALGLINSRPVNVLIVEPVRILAQPLSQTVSPGTTVTLTVTAAGSPPPIFQWRLNGVDIPGAVQSTLTLTNVQPTNGGSYNVVVASAGAALSSATATLLVTTTSHPFADFLQGSTPLIGSSGLRSGSNVGDTHESFETNHVGKLGGASVWTRWVAPSSGIATFSTRGSSFDTLLAIYTGTQMQNLVPVASDEDSGGFLTSQTLFSVNAGTEYRIAIDGFGGASGDIVLSWSLDTTTTAYPRFLSQPKDVSVILGGTTIFSVSLPNFPPVTYQWFHECFAIPGANNSTLVVGPVQVADVGRYHVEVMNTSNRTARSFDASLDIGPDVKVVSQDKLEDILGTNFVDSPGGFVPVAVGSSGFLSVSAGSISSQTFNNIGAQGQLGETNHCNVLGGSSKWYGIKPVVSGTFIIDTIGSSFDTVLAAYRATNLTYLSSALMACDDNSAPDGIRSVVKFNARGGRKYVVVVDGVNAAKGNISLNWKFGNAPLPNPAPPAQITVPAGTNVNLCAITNGVVPAPGFGWLFNGVPINGATQSCLTISNIQAQHAGTYSVIVSNVIGVATQTIAVITVGGGLRLVSHGLNANGQYSLSVTGIAGQRFILEANTNLSTTNWTSLLTTSLAAQPFLYFDTNTSRNRQRLYRTLNQ
jgi:hypothetical protein